jgi:ligand-binding sensor domain-containing protein
VRGEGFWRIYDDRGGLPGGIRPPVQDAQGHLWFGTKMSASRFDGQRFVDVGEPYLDTDVETLGPQSIFPDRNGNLWFMDGRGVVRYDGITFTRFTTEDGLSSNRMRYMMEDRRGVLWFVPAEPDSVSRFDGARFETMSAIALCCSNGAPIVEDEQGRIWVGTWKGVMRFDGEEWRTFTTHDGLGDDVVLGLYADEDGVWVGTRQGVSLYDGETFTFFDESHGVATGWGYTFLRDAAGVLWVGSAEFTSADGGLSRFDGEGWRLLGPDDGVPEGPALPLMLVRRSVGLFPEQHRPLRRAGVGDLPRTRRGGRRHRGPPGVLVVRGAALQRPGVAALQSRARSRD